MCVGGAVGFLRRAENVSVGVIWCRSWGMFFLIFLSVFGGFVGAVPIDGVWDVFSESHFRFRVSVVGGGGFPSRAESARWRIAGCISVGNVSFDFL